MQVNIKSNANEVAKRIGKKGKELSDSIKMALLRTGLVGLNIIEARTSKGTGFKGGAFKKYSPAYAAFRAEKGRSTKPDLRFTGQMMGAMTVRANSKEAEIFFTRAQESKKAAMNNKIRPFFGFDRSEERKLGQVFFKALK